MEDHIKEMEQLSHKMFYEDLTLGLESRKRFLQILVKISQSNNHELIQKAADQFPVNSLYNEPLFSEADATAFSTILTRVKKHIEKLLLFNCGLYTQQFSSISSAIMGMNETIDEFCVCHNELDSSDVDTMCQILPKINKKLCIVKCFAGKKGSRNANQEERLKLQQALQQLRNKELMIQLDDCGSELKNN
nr:uncharacterized protein LOC100180834 [Ciona intestinalis]|eukprot:XP_002131913.1 uncharacterized protein LOC100180834 [Ciona intestinalis]